MNPYRMPPPQVVTKSVYMLPPGPPWLWWVLAAAGVVIGLAHLPVRSEGQGIAYVIAGAIIAIAFLIKALSEGDL